MSIFDDLPKQIQLMQGLSAYNDMAISLEENVRKLAEKDISRDAAIQRTAQESIEHTRLLEKQLQEVKAQNEMLKAEAAGYHVEIEANKHAAKKARRLNIAAFIMSIVLPIIGIVASALIAKYI